MRRTTVGWVALTCLALAGCQGNSPTPPTNPAASASTTGIGTPPTTRSATTPGTGQPLHVDAATTAQPGTSYTLVADITAKTRAGDGQIVLALAPTGRALVAGNPLPKAGADIGQSTVGLIQSGQMGTWFTTPTAGKPRQAFVADVAPTGTSVWMETASTDLFNVDWTIFTGTGTGTGAHAAQIATSAKFVKGSPLPPAAGGTHLMATDGTSVWWAYTHPTPAPNTPLTSIAVAALNGTVPPRTVAHEGKLPVADGATLLYVRDPEVSTRTTGTFEIRSLIAGKDAVLTGGELAAGQTISGLCAGKSVLAWSITSEQDDPGGTVIVQDRTTRKQNIIALNDSARSIELDCGDNFAAWGNGSGSGDPSQYVATASGTLTKIGECPGVSVVHAAGSYLAWTLPPKSPLDPAITRIARLP